MANWLDQTIKELLRSGSSVNDPLTKKLIEKREELGDNATDAELKLAVANVLMDLMEEGDSVPLNGMELPDDINFDDIEETDLTTSNGDFGGFHGGDDEDGDGGYDPDDDDNDDDDDDDEDDDIVLSEEEANIMDDVANTVRRHLDMHDWSYQTQHPRADVILFDMGCHSDDVQLRIKIFVEAQPNVCRISVILPTSADVINQYPLCKLIANLNYPLRFGCFKYDERDGELSFEYSTLTNNGLTDEDLDQYMRACIHTAMESCQKIRKYAVGRFKRSEKAELKRKIRALLEDIDSDND